MLYILSQMEKEKCQKLELFHQPQLTFLDALTGPDILHATHQVVTTTIKLKRSSVDCMFKNHGDSLTFSFADQFGVDLEVPIIKMDFVETKNPNIISVFITGLFPIRERYRIEPLTGPENPMGY